MAEENILKLDGAFENDSWDDSDDSEDEKEEEDEQDEFLGEDEPKED
jgi:hypothetical protein